MNEILSLYKLGFSLYSDFTLASHLFLICLCLLFLSSLNILRPKRKRARKKKVSRTQWRKKRSKEWLKNFIADDGYSAQQKLAYLKSNKLDPFMFEDIVLEAFKRRGLKVQSTPYTRDGGVDGYVWINSKRVALQVKRYKNAIHKQHVKDLSTVVEGSRDIDLGLFIHTGRTSKPTQQYIRSNEYIELISGGKIIDLLEGKPVTVFGVRLNAGVHR